MTPRRRSRRPWTPWIRLVRQGKVRYVGCSNYPAWRLMQALWASDSRGLARYDSIQPHYNLANRAEFERELKDVVTEYEIGVIPYSPLAGGFLTGKYGRDSVADSVRADGIKDRYFNDAGWKTLDAVHAVADEVGSTPVAVSLAWLLAQPFMTVADHRRQYGRRNWRAAWPQLN